MGSAGNLVWIVISWSCALLFLGLASYSYNNKNTPVHFWSGTTVRKEEVRDIPAYNKENAIMWACYSAIYWVAGIIGVFNPQFGVMILLFSAFPGLLLLIFNYRRIQKKYFVKYHS